MCHVIPLVWLLPGDAAAPWNLKEKLKDLILQKYARFHAFWRRDCGNICNQTRWRWFYSTHPVWRFRHLPSKAEPMTLWLYGKNPMQRVFYDFVLLFIVCDVFLVYASVVVRRTIFLINSLRNCGCCLWLEPALVLSMNSAAFFQSNLIHHFNIKPEM